MATDKQIEDELDALATEIGALITQKAKHSSALHESDAAKRDVGSMRFCPGCRLIVLSRRLTELVSARDDLAPQQRFEGKSRREAMFAQIKERREIEASE